MSEIISFLEIGNRSNQELLIFLALFLFGFALMLFFIYFSFKKWRRGKAFDFILLRVAVPFEGSSTGDNQASPQETTVIELLREKIAVMEQFYSTLSDIGGSILNLKYFTLEIAVSHNKEEIAFYLAIPKNKVDVVEKQIHSFFPLVAVEKAEGYNVFPPKGETTGCYLKLSKDNYLPLKTYKELESDPLNSITNALSKLDHKKEGAAVQFVVSSMSGKDSSAQKLAKIMKQGKSLNQARDEVNHPVWHAVKGMIGSGVSSKSGKELEQDEKHILTPAEEHTIELIENKAKKNRFKVNIRLIATAPDKERAGVILSHLKNSFSQFNSDLNSFKAVAPYSLKDLIYDYTFRVLRKTHSFALCSEELASLFHLNINVLKAAPKIVSETAKKASAPTNIPTEGIILGENVFREEKTTIRLAEDDRRRHLYTIGQTGTGKSSFLSEMIKQDIQSGKGLCVIDPHGDLIEKVVSFVPKERAKDVILFDPSDVEMPMGLNLLEFDRPEQKTFVINEMINIFDKLYDLKQTGGPMFEQYMRNAMLLVMAHPESGSTLLEISRVLADADFRKFKLNHCSDQVVVNFWTKEAEKAGGEAALANMVPYITSKLTSFVANDIMRPIIAQQKSAFNLREIMDKGQIVLMNLSKGKIGELNAYLLGMVMVGKILMAAMSRVDIAEKDRKDFHLYIDEFHNFTTESVISILSEARKYRLSLVIAHQFLKQVPDETRDAVFGNVGSLVSFRIGPEDAEFVAKQLEPVFTSHDLVNLDNFNAYTKLMIGGKVSTPFSMRILPPSEGDNSIISLVKENSRKTYGKPREEVEGVISERLKQGGENTASDAPIESDMGIK